MEADIIKKLRERMEAWDRKAEAKHPGANLRHVRSDPNDICIKCEVLTDAAGRPVAALHYYVKADYIAELVKQGKQIIIREDEVVWH